MSAGESLSGQQFGGEIVSHPVPLDYQRAPKSTMQRRAVVDSEAGVRQRAAHRGPEKHDYWSPEIRQTKTASGAPLKRPKVYPNPNVVDPHTVAFADYHEPLPNRLYVDYVATRPDQTGHGHARRLIEDIAAQHPDHALDFGKIMHPGIAKIKDDLAARGREVYGRHDF